MNAHMEINEKHETSLKAEKKQSEVMSQHRCFMGIMTSDQSDCFFDMEWKKVQVMRFLIIVKITVTQSHKIIKLIYTDCKWKTGLASRLI